MYYPAPIKNAIKKLRKSFRLILSRLRGNEKCLACGFAGLKHSSDVLWPDLINEWELSPQWTAWVNEREGKSCVNCGCSLRTDQLCGAVISWLEPLTMIKAPDLTTAFDDTRVKALAIAEINSAGTIHPFLQKSPNLFYSEYVSNDPLIRSESLLGLSYANDFFDLVITSETLEHVPDIDIAFHEIHRVLKPGAAHIFTTPVIWDRPHTRVRAKVENGSLVNILPPSYHGSKFENQDDYLVFYEFGRDLVERCAGAGFHVKVLQDKNNPSLICFITTKK